MDTKKLYVVLGTIILLNETQQHFCEGDETSYPFFPPRSVAIVITTLLNL
jgi:hypothetical protein